MEKVKAKANVFEQKTNSSQPNSQDFGWVTRRAEFWRIQLPALLSTNSLVYQFQCLLRRCRTPPGARVLLGGFVR